MENDRKFRALAIAAICIAVVGVSVAYAALSTTLTITGTATVNSANSWNVRWENVSTDDVAPAVTSKSTSVTFAENTPTIAENNLTWDATFTAPGDTFTITAYITNDGTLNAKLGTGTDLMIAGDLSEYFTYSMTVNGKTIGTQTGNILKSGSRIPVVITVTLNNVDNATWETIGEAANKTVTFTASIPFVQATDSDTTEL